MKTVFTILVILQFGSLTLAQKTKKVNFKNDYPSYKETFYVLKSDKTVKHGLYTKTIGGKTVKKGSYENGVRKGIWEYYDFNGDLVHRVDIESKQILYDNSRSKNSRQQSIELSRNMIVLGGMTGVYKQIQILLRYPATARRNGTQGKVFVKLTFNEKGELSNKVVMEGPGDGLNEEAIRIFNLMDIEVLPALDKDGNPTQSEIIFPITFKLG